MKRRHSIDSLRGIGILLLLFLHVAVFYSVDHALIMDLLRMGSMGVQIFFVVSGYILALKYRNRACKPREFYQSRAKRVLPLFYFYLLANLLVFGLGPRYTAVLGNDIWSILANVLLIGWISPFYINSIVDGSWFLFSIALCYALFPFLHKWIKDVNDSLRWLFFALISSIILALIGLFILKPLLWGEYVLNEIYNNAVNSYLYYLPVHHLPAFLFGILIYHYSEHGKKIYVNKWLNLGLLLLIAFWISKGSFSRMGPNIYYALYGGLLLLFFLRSDVSFKFQGVLSFLGRRSYSIFLSHLFIIEILIRNEWVSGWVGE